MEVHARRETRDETKKNAEPEIVPLGVVVEEFARVDQGCWAARGRLLYGFVFIIAGRNLITIWRKLRENWQ